MSVRTASARIDPPVQQVAFFDVDGTLAKSNVVYPFVIIRLAKLHFFVKLFWVPFFALKCIFYILLDQYDRQLFNKLFYQNYAGHETVEKTAMANRVHKEYMHPRVFEGARKHIAQLQERGLRVVFVTGSLDFLVEPLAKELGADAVIAAKLEEQDGKFTGNLDGPAISNEQKAVAMRRYAQESNLDLAHCQAYGDSYADLAMLEAVGSPFVVRPSKRLSDIAKARGWPLMDW